MQNSNQGYLACWWGYSHHPFVPHPTTNSLACMILDTRLHFYVAICLALVSSRLALTGSGSTYRNPAKGEGRRGTILCSRGHFSIPSPSKQSTRSPLEHSKHQKSKFRIFRLCTCMCRFPQAHIHNTTTQPAMPLWVPTSFV